MMSYACPTCGGVAHKMDCNFTMLGAISGGSRGGGGNGGNCPPFLHKFFILFTENSTSMFSATTNVHYFINIVPPPFPNPGSATGYVGGYVEIKIDHWNE